MKIDLRDLAKDSRNALQLGKAAEHLVCADLLLQGRVAFLADQGSPYDIVVDLDGKFVRVQVKATCFVRNINCQNRNESFAYTWNIRKRGKGGSGERLSEKHCDVVALVALDIRKVSYVHISACSQTVTLRPCACLGKLGFTMDELSSFEAAVNGFPASLGLRGRKAPISPDRRKRTYIRRISMEHCNGVA